MVVITGKEIHSERMQTMRTGETKMYSIYQLLHKAFVTTCPLCAMNAYAGDLCEGCARDVLRMHQQGAWCQQCGVAVAQSYRRCAQCVRWNPAFSQTLTTMDYAYPGAMLVRGLKEHGRLANARLFARMLAQTLTVHRRSLPPIGALVPIPASLASLRRRGFNPAAEIARTLSAHSAVPFKSWLIRSREGHLQKVLDSGARRHSVRGLYQCAEPVAPIWVGVVDDVMTSGSTMHEAALALRHAGALGVVALVAARAVWEPTLSQTEI
jgi:ComF family protein